MENTFSFLKKIRNALRSSAFVCFVCFGRVAPCPIITGCSKNIDGVAQGEPSKKKVAKNEKASAPTPVPKNEGKTLATISRAVSKAASNTLTSTPAAPTTEDGYTSAAENEAATEKKVLPNQKRDAPNSPIPEGGKELLNEILGLFGN